jgi:hypothetical protein
MGRDIFISCAAKELEIAIKICSILESRGYTCGITPRDILSGTDYTDGIVQAIDECRIFVLIFSADTNSSPHIVAELEIAFSNKIFIIPIRIDDSNPSKGILYFIGMVEWIDASNNRIDLGIEDLISQIRKNLNVEKPEFTKK